MFLVIFRNVCIPLWLSHPVCVNTKYTNYGIPVLNTSKTYRNLPRNHFGRMKQSCNPKYENKRNNILRLRSSALCQSHHAIPYCLYSRHTVFIVGKCMFPVVDKSGTSCYHHFVARLGSPTDLQQVVPISLSSSARNKLLTS